MLSKKRDGFTLIELLIVIVIIGILAAIAIPKFGKTREKAYFKAMMSDLRNLQSQQEVYYSNPVNGYTYATSTTNLGVRRGRASQRASSGSPPVCRLALSVRRVSKRRPATAGLQRRDRPRCRRRTSRRAASRQARSAGLSSGPGPTASASSGL